MHSKWFDLRLMVVLLVALLTTVAVACGGDDEDEDAPAAPAAQVQPTPESPIRLGPTVVPPQTQPPTPKPVAKAEPAEPKAKPEPAAVADDKPQYGGHFRQAFGFSFPPKLDITQTSTFTGVSHLRRHYNGVLQFSPRDGIEIIPALATTWGLSSDGLTYTFDIDPRVTQWNDGTPFDVDDIIWSYNRWIDPPSGLIQPRVGGLKQIASMEKVDAVTLNITVQQQFGDFIAEVANGWHAVLPRHILEANDNTLASPELIVGTGPYLIDEVEEGVSVSSLRNPDYFRTDPDGNQYPYLDQYTSITLIQVDAVIAATRTKRLDASESVAGSFVEQKKIVEENPGKFTHTEGAVTVVGSVQMNNTMPPFDDINARKAVFYGYNKARVVENHGEQDPINPIGFFGNEALTVEEIANLPGYNPANRAEEARMAQEFVDKSGLTEFEMKAVPFRVADAELLAQDMAEFGVKVDIVQVDWSAMVAAAEGKKYEAAHGGTAPSYAGAVPLIDLLYSDEGGRNGGWKAPDDWNALWGTVKTMSRSPERRDLLREMHDIMLNDWVPLMPYLGDIVQKSWWNYVHNLDNVAQGIFSNGLAEDIWLDQDAPTR